MSGVLQCATAGSPQMNSDVSGSGVRTSFYIQAFALALIAVRNNAFHEKTAALYTLVATNIAMVITSYVVGFGDSAYMSLQDAIVVLYLLSLSWCSIFFAMHFYKKEKNANRSLRFMSGVQSYLVIGFALAVFIKAPKFGSHPECNENAFVSIFHPIKVLNAGRVLGILVACTGLVLHTSVLVSDLYPTMFMKPWANVDSVMADHKLDVQGDEKEIKQIGGVVEVKATPWICWGRNKLDHPQGRQDVKTKVAGISIMIVLLILGIVNTELLVGYNVFAPAEESSPWQYGEVLPIFLIIVPLIGAYSPFSLVRQLLYYLIGNRENDEDGREVPMTSVKTPPHTASSFSPAAADSSFSIDRPSNPYFTTKDTSFSREFEFPTSFTSRNNSQQFNHASHFA